MQPFFFGGRPAFPFGTGGDLKNCVRVRFPLPLLLEGPEFFQVLRPKRRGTYFFHFSFIILHFSFIFLNFSFHISSFSLYIFLHISSFFPSYFVIFPPYLFIFPEALEYIGFETLKNSELSLSKEAFGPPLI